MVTDQCDGSYSQRRSHNDTGGSHERSGQLMSVGIAVASYLFRVALTTTTSVTPVLCDPVGSGEGNGSSWSAGSHCTRGALTSSFGWFVQGVLAGLAFTCLILKRFCEPKRRRRSWMIWFYDTSKQGLGALVIHFANVFLAEFFHGDPCTWYIVSFLLDSSIGLLIIYIGIRLTQRIARKKGWVHLVFGEYGKPPQVSAWLSQCGVYVSLMLIEKLAITLLIQLKFWDQVREFILSPIKDPKVEIAIVVLVIPFIINVIMFWVTDNFLMHQHVHVSKSSKGKLCSKSQYWRRESPFNSAEMEILLSDEDESASELGLQQRHNTLVSVT